MAVDMAEEFIELSRHEAEEELLVVTVYTADEIRHEYIIDEVEAQADQIALDSLHRPVQSIHRTLE